MSYGIKVAKPGYDVKTCGYNELVISTEYPLLKIFMTGSGTNTLSLGETSEETVITHNLGYIPMYSVMSQFADGEGWSSTKYKMVPYYIPTTSGYVKTATYADITTTTLTVGVIDNLGATDADIAFYYIIYANREQ